MIGISLSSHQSGVNNKIQIPGKRNHEKIRKSCYFNLFRPSDHKSRCRRAIFLWQSLPALCALSNEANLVQITADFLSESRRLLRARDGDRRRGHGFTTCLVPKLKRLLLSRASLSVIPEWSSCSYPDPLLADDHQLYLRGNYHLLLSVSGQ